MASLSLPDVTLVAVTSVATAATVRAITKSMLQADFGRVLLLCDKSPRVPVPSSVEIRIIEPLTSRDAYSNFMCRSLAAHVATSHALCIQWDGYVLDATKWDPHFLDYDYIGARWPHFHAGGTVGNGGFSLRSRRLLDACVSARIDPAGAEDIAICRTHRSLLEQTYGIRFADERVADKFAYERTERSGTEFGFHGVFNMMDLLSRAEFQSVLTSLEQGLLGRREWRDLLAQAIRAGRLETILFLIRDRWAQAGPKL